MRRSSDRRESPEGDADLERLAGRIHVLTERVDTLAQSVATTVSATAKKDGEMVVLRRELTEGLARIEKSVGAAGPGADASEIRELREQVAALKVSRPRLSDDGRIDDLAAKMNILTERVSTLATTVSTVSAGLARHDGELASARRKLEESAAQADRGSLDEELVRRIEDATTKASTAMLSSESHGTQLAGLRQEVEQRDADRDAALEELRSALGAQSDLVTQAVSDLAERIEPFVAERLEEMSSRIDVAERERASLATSVAEAAGSRWAELERLLSQLGERLDAAEERTAAMESQVTRATTLWPAALRSLEVKVEELARTPAPAPLPLTPLDPHGSSVEPREEDGHYFDELRALESRLAEAETSAREEREAALTRLERLASQFDWRLQRVEAEQREATHQAETASMGAEVLPLHAGDS